jgi:hypothetical protein
MEKKDFHRFYNDLDINKGKDKKFIKKEADIFYKEGKRLHGKGVVDNIQDFLFKYLTKFLGHVVSSRMDDARNQRINNPQHSY